MSLSLLLSRMWPHLAGKLVQFDFLFRTASGIGWLALPLRSMPRGVALLAALGLLGEVLDSSRWRRRLG